MGNGRENSSPIAGIGLTSTGTAMRHMFQHPQGVIHDLTGFLPLNVRHEPDAARIVLVRRIVKSMCLGCPVRMEQFRLTLKESLGHVDVF